MIKRKIYSEMNIHEKINVKGNHVSFCNYHDRKPNIKWLFYNMPDVHFFDYFELF